MPDPPAQNAPTAPQGDGPGTAPGTAPAPSQNGAQSAAPPSQPPEGDELSRVQAALDAERRQHADTQRQLSKAQQSAMTDDERKLDEARQEGRTAAVREAALRVAAAEFRAAAQGKLSDPAAALEVLDLSKFIDDKGEVDTKAIGVLVEKLIKSLPAAPAGKMPAGPRGGAPAESDFLRGVLGSSSPH